MLSGERCYLRAIEPSDVDVLYQIENDVDLWKDGAQIQPVTRFSIEGLAAQAGMDVFQTHQLRLMVCDINTDEELGCVDLFDFDPHNMNGGVGIMIRSEYREQGYGSEALSVFADYLFSQLHLHSLTASIRRSNEASLNLFHKCGFERVGVRREWIRTNEGYEDEVIMQLVATR